MGTREGVRGRGWWVAVGVLVVVVVAGVIGLAVRVFTPSGGGSVDDSTVRETVTETVPAGRCPRRDEPVMEGEVLVAPHAQWQLVGRVAAPSVEGAGPVVVDDDGWRSCYARTPTGAVVAAANLVAMGSSRDLDHRMITDGIVDSALRDQLLASPPTSSDTAVSSVQIRGFQLVAYDGEHATVDVLTQGSEGGYTSCVVSLVWADEEWRYDVRTGAAGVQELGLTVTNIPSSSGYIMWSGT